MSVTIKTWLIGSKIDAETANYFQSLGCRVCVEEPKLAPIATPTSVSYMVVGRAKVTIQSCTEEQETMIKLKFMPNLGLLSEEYFHQPEWP